MNIYLQWLGVGGAWAALFELALPPLNNQMVNEEEIEDNFGNIILKIYVSKLFPK